MSLGTVMPDPKFTGFDSNGDPLAGGFLYTYAAGTLTALATYNNADLDPSHANANPVELDAAGRATVFLSAATYKFILKTSADVTVWTVDGVAASSPFEANLDVPGTAGEALSAGEVVYLSTGAGGTTAGRWYKADADAAATSSTANAIGMIPDAIASGAEGSIRLQGRIEGLVGLTPGAPYYVSATAGALTATPPVNVRFVGAADSATSLVMTATLNGGVGVFSSLTVTGNATIGGTLTQTGVATFTAAPVLSALTASQAVFTDGSKALTSNAITGSGNVVMSASPTLTGTITAAALTASGLITASGGVTGNVTGNVSGTAATVTNATQASITTCSNLVTVGALNSGSITSGFGAIDIGVDALTAGTATFSGLVTSTANGTNPFGGGGTGSTSSVLQVDGGSAADNGSGVFFRRNSVTLGLIGTRSLVLGGTSNALTLRGASSDGVEVVASDASGDVRIYSRNTLAATFGASQLLTLSGNLTVNGGTASVVGAEGGNAVLNIYADEGDDTNDRWTFTATTAGTMTIANASGGTSLTFDATGSITCNDVFSLLAALQLNGGATLLETINTLTNGAGANTGTLTNSPVTGNPTKWIAINDAGVTRYIPAW